MTARSCLERAPVVTFMLILVIGAQQGFRARVDVPSTLFGVLAAPFVFELPYRATPVLAVLVVGMLRINTRGWRLPSVRATCRPRRAASPSS
jgi:hypothetical protein